MSRTQKDIALRNEVRAAIGWFVQRRSVASSTNGEALQDWLHADPIHAEAYADVEGLWRVTHEVSEEPEILALRGRLGAGFAHRRIGRRAIAAGLAAAVVGLAALGLHGLTTPRTLVDQSFRTAVGQQATVTLPDGSFVTLNTDTVVRTRADGDRRLVYLDKGQAFFRVAKGRSRPFIVTAGGRTVTALGTAFDVRVDNGGLEVVLVEGKVRVENLPSGPRPSRDKTAGEAVRAPAAIATEMGPGSQLIATGGESEWRVFKADVARETSWLNGQIVVSDEPLANAVRELNRYSKRKIVLDDPALAQVRVSGIFRPGDLEGFVRALKTSGMAAVDQDDESELRLARAK